jgi:hypothetical protein
LSELLEKAGDGDFLHRVEERLMGADVDGLIYPATCCLVPAISS